VSQAPAGSRSRASRDAPAQAGLVRHVQQVRAQQQRASAVEVGVVVDEAGRDEAAGDVDHLRGVPAVRHDLGTAAHRLDAVAGHGHGLCPRPVGIARPDALADEREGDGASGRPLAGGV
jgi:hypothetical protein